MPKTTKQGQPKRSELPGTLKRSSAKAQRTFAKAHDSALDEYGDEERAKSLGVDGRSRMTKGELAQAIARAQD
jgi:cation transport regulator ChaB